MKRKRIAKKWNETYHMNELLALGGKDPISETRAWGNGRELSFIYDPRCLLLDQLRETPIL